MVDLEVKEEVIDDDDFVDDVEWLMAPVTPRGLLWLFRAPTRLEVQTLQTAPYEIELQNQQLRTRVTEMESHMGILMSYMLWMEERLTVCLVLIPDLILTLESFVLFLLASSVS
nr:hypothetical protein [Tanacetum cinerariifolium]